MVSGSDGAGLNVSHKFGFGAIDAEAIVTRGRHWENVPVQQSQDIVPLKTSEIIPFGRNFSKNFTVESDIVFLEHVMLDLSLSFLELTSVWPYVEVNLTSPSGTTTTLLPQYIISKPLDLDVWSLMSVHFWGENPAGTWIITVFYSYTFGSIEIAVPKVTLYGTSKVPEAVSHIPPEGCSPECNQTRGCAASGPEFCYACRDKYLRVASTRDCVSSCPEGLTKYDGYCYNDTEPEESCGAEKPRSAVHDLKVKGLSL